MAFISGQYFIEVVSWMKRSRSDGSASFFLFVRSVLSSETLKRRLGGLPRLAIRLSKIPLDVPLFTVQNGHASSCVAHRTAPTDRAEIGRIRRLLVQLDHLRLADHSRERADPLRQLRSDVAVVGVSRSARTSCRASVGGAARLRPHTQLLPGAGASLGLMLLAQEVIRMDAKAEKVALFRYGLIAPLVLETLRRGELTHRAEEIAARQFDIPASKRTSVSVDPVTGLGAPLSQRWF